MFLHTGNSNRKCSCLSTNSGKVQNGVSKWHLTAPYDLICQDFLLKSLGYSQLKFSYLPFSKQRELGRLWRPLSPWCCDVFYPRVLESPGEKPVLVCPIRRCESSFPSRLSNWPSSQGWLWTPDPPASTSQVPGLGVRHPAQRDYAAFHRTAKYIQDKSKISSEYLNPSV